jgi:hypothetical protein
LFYGHRSQKSFEIKVDDRVVNSQKTLDLWLNSCEFHFDSDKKLQIDRINELMPLQVSKVFFVMLLSDKMEAIVNTANFLAVFIGKSAIYGWDDGEITRQTAI